MKWEAPSNIKIVLIANYSSNTFVNHDIKGERNGLFIIPKRHSLGTKIPIFVLNKKLMNTWREEGQNNI